MNDVQTGTMADGNTEKHKRVYENETKAKLNLMVTIVL